MGNLAEPLLDKLDESWSLEDTIHYEVVNSLFMVLPASLLSIAAIAGSLVVILWSAVDTIALSFWYVVLLVILLVRFISYKRYVKSEKSIQNIYYWDRFFYVLLIFVGLTWLSFSFWLLPDHESIYHYISVLILIGLSSGSVMTLGFKMSNVITYFIFLLFPIFIIEILADTLISYLIAFLIVVFSGLAFSSAKRFNQTLITNISLRYSAEKNKKQLIESKNIAIEANNTKSAFISMISHELRTPLNGVLGYAQLLQLSDNPPLSDEQKENNSIIIESGNYLLSLIEELLDLSSIESNKLKVDIDAVSLNSVLDDSLKILGAVAKEHNIEIVTNIEKAYSVKADKKRLKQIFINLISNAVKYNNEYGKITIAINKNINSRVKISISDTGNGLTKEQVDRLFLPFQRHEYQKEGLGLGLYIAKNLIELMNGKMGVESTVGEGSTFWFEVPLVEN